METGIWRSLRLLSSLEPVVPGQADLLLALDVTLTGNCDLFKTGENYGPVSRVVHPTRTDSSLLARKTACLASKESPLLCALGLRVSQVCYQVHGIYTQQHTLPCYFFLSFLICFDASSALTCAGVNAALSGSAE